MSSERLKSGRFFRKIGRKKGTKERSRASVSSSSSTPPSAASPPPELNPSASSDAESSAVAKIDAEARPLTIAEHTTPTSSSTATYSGDQSPNDIPRAKGEGKGKGRVEDGEVEPEEERVKNVLDGRKKGTNQRGRASVSSSSSTPPSAASPPPELNRSASSDAESSAVAKIDAEARPLTIAEHITPTSSSTATYSGDQSPNASPRAKGKGKGKGRVGDGEVEHEEERVKNPAEVIGGLAGGEDPAQVIGGRARGEDIAQVIRGSAGSKKTADEFRAGGENIVIGGSDGGEDIAQLLAGSRRRMESGRQRVMLRRLSDRLQLESIERENERRKKQWKWEKAAREADRAERAAERGERAAERDERNKKNAERATERENERVERENERTTERTERAKEREERAKEREEARNMASLTTLDNLSSGMVGASATLVTSLLGLHPTEDGQLLRLVLGIAGAFVLGLNAAVLAGIGSGLHRWVTPSTFGSLTLALRVIVGVIVLLIAIGINFLYKFLENK